MPDLLTIHTALDQLDKKATGQLILAGDWNDVVDSLINLGSRLGTLEGENLDTRLKALEDKDLDARLAKLEAAFVQAEKVINQFYAVSITAGRSTYALGEAAEITVQVAEPMDHMPIKPGASAPWVDFVCTWGRLKPAPGFGDTAVAGDRALSVRADANGQAKVLLYADHVGSLTAEDLDAVHNYLSSAAGAGTQTVAQFVLAARAPAAVTTNGVFASLSQAYETNDSVRRFADTYAIARGPEIAGLYIPKLTSWRDYHATVLTFVRSDDDPTSPDHRHGSESIALTFRDWVYHWIGQYIDKSQLADHAKDVAGRLVGGVNKGDYVKTVGTWQKEVGDTLFQPGLIRTIRETNAVDLALDSVAMTDAPDYLNDLKSTMRQAVQIQQSHATGEAAAIGGAGNAVTFQVISSTATRPDAAVSASVSGVTQRIDGLEAKLGDVDGRVTGVQTQLQPLRDQVAKNVSDLRSSISVVNAQVNELKTGTVQMLQSQVQDATNTVAAFKALNLSADQIQKTVASVATVQKQVDLASGTIAEIQKAIAK